MIYDFGGPYPPVAAGLNAVKAGQAVPLKFSLAGDQGMDVLTAAFSQPVACDTLEPIGGMAPAEWAGQSGLSYDPETGWYSVVWKTEKAWAGTCRALMLKLIDGTEHKAYFQFK